FPESPPPGLVTVPTAADAPKGYHEMAGYRAAGERAIRIDMLERLADMLRSEDSRGGFEAKADMLSITGMTLEQFAVLMEGLGYKSEKGERAKVKPVADASADDTPGDAPAEAAAEETPAETPEEAPTDPVAEDAPVEERPAEEPSVDTPAEPDVEIFYTFTWGGNRPRREQRPGGQGKPKGKPRGKPKGKRAPQDKGAKSFSARPPKRDKIDPDNPFAAALMGLTKKD
ncbi:MAG: disulfide oxidoreductase, partial [Pseudomonadota bacterium]